MTRTQTGRDSDRDGDMRDGGRGFTPARPASPAGPPPDRSARAAIPPHAHAPARPGSPSAAQSPPTDPCQGLLITIIRQPISSSSDCVIDHHGGDGYLAGAGAWRARRRGARSSRVAERRPPAWLSPASPPRRAAARAAAPHCQHINTHSQRLVGVSNRHSRCHNRNFDTTR